MIVTYELLKALQEEVAKQKPTLATEIEIQLRNMSQDTEIKR